MLEIEVKARVRDHGAVRARLDEDAVFVAEVTKQDLYYGPEDKSARAVDVTTDRVFRLRKEGERWLVTAKTRRVEDDVEVNEEIELAIEDPAAFRALAQHLGFRPFIVKRKRTRAYSLGHASVELSRIEPLGDFLEVEMLLPDDADPGERAYAQGEVRAILLRLGVREEDIEPRPYVDLLRQVGTGRPA